MFYQRKCKYGTVSCVYGIIALLVTLQPTPHYTLHPTTPCTLHPAPYYTLHPAPYYTLHPAPGTRQTTPYNLNLGARIHSRRPSMLAEPTPYTLHPTPYTLHCAYTLNPKPQTWVHAFISSAHPCSQNPHSSPVRFPYFVLGFRV